ncbi:MAG: thymidylate kinase [Terriglobales bacterium]
MKHPFLISFSGLDGSGKSTQIAELKEYLEAGGLRVATLAFWDDVVVGKKWREGFVHRVYKSEKGIGAPGKPVARRDKNVRKWYLSIARHLLYTLDAANLGLVVGHALRSGHDVIIMDRYIYDELANLPLTNPITRLFVRLVHALAPRPDVAYLLDVDVEAARERKPEYPVDFMRTCRLAYFQLDRMLGTMMIIPPLPLAEATAEMVGVARKKLQCDSAEMVAA